MEAPHTRIGAIACGGRGENARKAHQPENGFRLVAAADVNADARTGFKQAFPESAVYGDYREMLAREKLDAVIISSPLELHEEMTLAALARGCSVFLEKPMAPTVESCDRLLAAAAKARAHLFIGHNLRHYSFLAALKEVVDAGDVGEVKTIWCRHAIGYSRHADDYFRHETKPFFSYGMLLHKGCHDLDAIHWLGGAPSRRVVGMGGATAFADGVPVDPSARPDAVSREDDNMLLMELENGVRATYTGCAYTPAEMRSYTVVGTLGTVENTGENYGTSTIHLRSNRHGATRYTSFQTPPARVDENYDADLRCLQRFLDTLRLPPERRPAADGESGRHAVAAAVAGQTSIRQDSAPQPVPGLRAGAVSRA